MCSEINVVKKRAIRRRSYVRVCGGGDWRYSVPASNKPFRCLFVCLLTYWDICIIAFGSFYLWSVLVPLFAWNLTFSTDVMLLRVPLCYVTAGGTENVPKFGVNATSNCAWSSDKNHFLEYTVGCWTVGEHFFLTLLRTTFNQGRFMCHLAWCVRFVCIGISSCLWWCVIYLLTYLLTYLPTEQLHTCVHRWTRHCRTSLSAALLFAFQSYFSYCSKTVRFVTVIN